MERLLELMLYREVGGIGYDKAIEALAKGHPKFYLSISNNIESIRAALKED